MRFDTVIAKREGCNFFVSQCSFIHSCVFYVFRFTHLFNFATITNPLVRLSVVGNPPLALLTFRQCRIDMYRIAKRDDSASLRRGRVAGGRVFARVVNPDHKSLWRIAADRSAICAHPSSLAAAAITFAPPTTQSSWSNHRRLDSNSLRFGVDYASYVNEKQSLFGCMSPRIITRNENLYSPDIVIAVVILANKPLNTTKILKTRNTFCRTRSLSNATFSFLITWRPPSSKSAAVYKISLKSDDFYRASAYWRAILI